jgi:hypothetical protein
MAEHAQPATLVILGIVEHSAQLVAESYQPAVFSAFFQRVQPDIICVEGSPHEFLRGDYYEYSYELQHVAVPFAREEGIPVFPSTGCPRRTINCSSGAYLTLRHHHSYGPLTATSRSSASTTTRSYG